jgi:hypothetical protein
MTIAYVLLKLSSFYTEIALEPCVAQFGYTPLHCAIMWGKNSVAAVLIEKGADVEAQTEVLDKLASSLFGICNPHTHAQNRDRKKPCAQPFARATHAHTKIVANQLRCIGRRLHQSGHLFARLLICSYFAHDLI